MSPPSSLPPDACRRLILQIDWREQSEEELALAFGLTRQGVDERKRPILDRLRASRESPT